MKLKNKVAIITGAGRGLGRAIALAMAGEGARVSIISRSSSEITHVSREIKDHGGSVLDFQGDISQEQTATRMAEKTLEAFSTIDILVNNAAIIGPPQFLTAPDSREWLNTLDVNLMGAVYFCRAVLPVMISQKSGKIINITSGLGQRPFPRFSAYGVSKAGLIQLTRSLSEELKDFNIQVNAIDPGVMDTPMQSEVRSVDEESLGPQVSRNFRDLHEQKLLKPPDLVAPLAVFLATEASDHITGQNRTLDEYGRLKVMRED